MYRILTTMSCIGGVLSYFFTNTNGMSKPRNLPSEPIHTIKYSSAVMSLPATLAFMTSAV